MPHHGCLSLCTAGAGDKARLLGGWCQAHRCPGWPWGWEMARGAGEGQCTKAVLPGLGGLAELGSHCPGTHSLQWGNTTDQRCSLLCCLPRAPGDTQGSQSDTFGLCHIPICSLTSQITRSVVWHDSPILWLLVALGWSQARSPPHHPGLPVASLVFLRQLSLFKAEDKSFLCMPWVALCCTPPPHRPIPTPSKSGCGLDVPTTAGTEGAQPWLTPGPTSLAHFISLGQD